MTTIVAVSTAANTRPSLNNIFADVMCFVTVGLVAALCQNYRFCDLRGASLFYYHLF